MNQMIDTSKKEKKKKQKFKIRSSQRQCVELGDPKFVCFNINKLEFFSSAQNFAQHSQYFRKILEKQLNEPADNDNEESESEEEKEEQKQQNPQQIVMRLPRDTLPSVLHLVQKYIDNQLEGFFSDPGMQPDIDTLFKVALIADDLKMRNLQAELLTNTVLQMLNKQNVIEYLSPAHARIKKNRDMYRMEEIEIVSEKQKSAKKHRKRKRRQRDSSSSSSSDSDSGEGLSDSYDSCEDVNESSSDESSSESGRKTPIKKQIELPFDKNEIVAEIKDAEQTWNEFLQYCVDLTACNLQYIIMTREEEFVHKVHPDVIDQVVSRNIQFFQGNPSYDNRSLIQLLQRVRGCHSVFELLKLEKEKIIKDEAEERVRNIELNIQKEPLLVWSVDSITNYFYKQSDSIHIQGAYWRLALSYFKKQSTCLKVDLKIMNSPFDTKKAKEYYRKYEFGVPANLDVQKIDPMAQFEVEEVDIELQQQRVNQLNAAAANFTNHSFVSFIASIDLFKNAPPNKARIHSMICSQKSPVQLLALENFDVNNMQEEAISVSLQFEIKQMHSQLLQYISKNFTFLLHEPEIRHLTKDDFKLLLRHKYLNVTQEDEVLKAVCLWLEGQTLMQKKPAYANIPKRSLIQAEKEDGLFYEDSADYAQHLKQDYKDQVKRSLILELNEIIQYVNWDYVSLPCLLDILRNEPMMRKCETFQKAVKAQFAVRMNRDSLEAIEAAQGQFNCEPRFSYKYNTSQRNLYPTEGDLSFQSRGPIQAISGSKSQFQLLYPVQIYPDFLQHLADCMISPIDIVKKLNGQGFSITKQPQQTNPILVNAGFAETPNPDKEAHEQQNIRKRHLQQQLLKKELEMQQIQCQLNAIDILDKLNEQLQPQHENSNNIKSLASDARRAKQVNFGDLDSQIQRAKEEFKMRIAGGGRRGQPSDRLHLNQESNSQGSNRLNNQDGLQDDSSVLSEESDEEQEVYPEEESEIEEFKVENSKPSLIIPKKRLSEVVEENKIEQQNRRINDENIEKNDKDLEAEWERINENHNQHELAPDSSQQLGNFQQSQMSGNSNSCVQDYAQLQVERKNWSSSHRLDDVSSQQPSPKDSYRDPDQLVSPIGAGQMYQKIQVVPKPQKSAQASDSDRDQQAYLQAAVRQGHKSSDGSSPREHKRVKMMSMQMSLSEKDEVRMNSSIQKNNSERSSELQVNAALSENIEQEQIGHQVNKQLKAIKERSHSNSTDNSNSREESKDRIPRRRRSRFSEKEIQTDTIDFERPTANKIFRNQEGQTEIEMSFMHDLLLQMNQKKIIEQELQRMLAVTNIDKREQQSQTIGTASTEDKGTMCNLLEPVQQQPRMRRQQIMTQQNEVVQLQIIENNNGSIEYQNFDGLNPASSFFNSQDSVSSRSKEDDVSVEERKQIISSSEDDLGIQQIQMQSDEMPSQQRQLDGESIKLSQSEEESLQSNSQARKLTPRAVEDLVNGKGQIKELTFDIFAILSSEQSAVPPDASVGLKKEDSSNSNSSSESLKSLEQSQSHSEDQSKAESSKDLSHESAQPQAEAVEQSNIDLKVPSLGLKDSDPLKNFLENQDAEFTEEVIKNQENQQPSNLAIKQKSGGQKHNKSTLNQRNQTALVKTSTPTKRRKTPVQHPKKLASKSKPKQQEKFVPSLTKYSATQQHQPQKLKQKPAQAPQSIVSTFQNQQSNSITRPGSRKQTITSPTNSVSRPNQVISKNDSSENALTKKVSKNQHSRQASGSRAEVQEPTDFTTAANVKKGGNTMTTQYGLKSVVGPAAVTKKPATQHQPSNQLSKFLSKASPKHQSISKQNPQQPVSKTRPPSKEASKQIREDRQAKGVSADLKHKQQQKNQRKMSPLKVVAETNNQMELSQTSESSLSRQSDGGILKNAEDEEDEEDFEGDEEDQEEDTEQADLDFKAIKINLGKKETHDSSPCEESKLSKTQKLHVPPSRDRPQSNVNFVKSKLSNLIQGANLLDDNLNFNSEEEPGQGEKQEAKDHLSESLEDSSDNSMSREQKLIVDSFEQQTPPLLDLKGYKPANIDNLINFRAEQKSQTQNFPNILLSDSENEAIDEPEDGQGIQNSNRAKDYKKSGPKRDSLLACDSLVHSSNQSGSGTFPGAQADLFSNRDEGLACFNILDHLRKNSSKNLAEAVDSAKKPEIATANINLKQLREMHISTRKINKQDITKQKKKSGSKAD